jgi:putative toxin-antitoxin system antitoxin component (TIGR02293 family)
MKLDKELSDLEASFNRVAAAMKRELPDVWDEAMEIWRNEADAVDFLRRPHMSLNGKKPAEEALASPEGRRNVLDLLGRIKYGVY